jgi:hypothetical protein
LFAFRVRIIVFSFLIIFVNFSFFSLLFEWNEYCSTFFFCFFHINVDYHVFVLLFLRNAKLNNNIFDFVLWKWCNWILLFTFDRCDEFIRFNYHFWWILFFYKRVDFWIKRFFRLLSSLANCDKNLWKIQIFEEMLISKIMNDFFIFCWCR